MVVLVVNMADTYVSNSVSFDLVEHGIAITPKDKCQSSNLINGIVEYKKGGDLLTFSDLQPHASVVLKIACDPF